MADVTLTVYTPTRATGVAVTDNHTNATAGTNYLFANDERTVLIATCTDGGGGTATVDVPATEDGNAIADRTLTLAANKQLVFGPWPKTVYGTTVSVTVSAATDLLAMSLAY
jgi:hypothetical protein